MKTSIGLDIGGTKTLVAVFDAQGGVAFEREVKTPADYDSFIRACAELGFQAREAAGGDTKIGVAVPGVYNDITGQTLSGNLPFLNGRALREDLGAALQSPVRIANDMNCASLAEARLGAGRDYRAVFCLTLSTGVGSCFVLDGQFYAGRHGIAGEIGHLPLPFRSEADGPCFPCICKQDECIEVLLCGPGLARLYKMRTGRELQPPEIAQQARENDPEAKAVLAHYYDMLARALLVPLAAYDPEVILISGGMRNLPDMYEALPPLVLHHSYLKAFNAKIAPAALDKYASARGAGLLWG